MNKATDSDEVEKPAIGCMGWLCLAGIVFAYSSWCFATRPQQPGSAAEASLDPVFFHARAVLRDEPHPSSAAPESCNPECSRPRTEFVAELAQAAAAHVRRNTKVTLTLECLKASDGLTVERLEPIVSAPEHASRAPGVNVVLRDTASSNALSDKFSVDVWFQLEGVLTIPRSSVFLYHGQWSALRINTESQSLERKELKIGFVTEERVEILAGLARGEAVVDKPLADLVTGTRLSNREPTRQE